MHILQVALLSYRLLISSSFHHSGLSQLGIDILAVNPRTLFPGTDTRAKNLGPYVTSAHVRETAHKDKTYIPHGPHFPPVCLENTPVPLPKLNGSLVRR